MFKILDSLRYHAISCDVIPEYKLTAPDGTVYYIELTGDVQMLDWVWRRPSLIGEVDNEAPLKAEVIDAIYANWDKLDIVAFDVY